MVAEGFIGYIGIGSNLGNPLEYCRDAIAKMSNLDDLAVLRESSFYKTEPVGFTDQNDFVNAVCEIRTRLSPGQLLKALKNIEKRMGRQDEHRWGPRIIDLDILLYGQNVISDKEHGLMIPHPDFHKRRFVLVPLCEIASYVIHPAFGVSIRGLLDRLDDNSYVELMP